MSFSMLPRRVGTVFCPRTMMFVDHNSFFPRDFRLVSPSQQLILFVGAWEVHSWSTRITLCQPWVPSWVCIKFIKGICSVHLRQIVWKLLSITLTQIMFEEYVFEKCLFWMKSSHHRALQLILSRVCLSPPRIHHEYIYEYTIFMSTPSATPTDLTWMWALWLDVN